MECDYCKKTYKTTSSFNLHQRTSKSCLAIQGKQSMFLCSFCNKQSSSKSRLQEHLIRCKVKQNKEREEIQMNELKKKWKIEIELELEMENKLKQKDKELEELRLKDEKIKELEARLNERAPQKISNKTKTINNIDTQNNTINIYQVMTPDHVLEVFQKHYKLDNLLGGQKAMARFINEEFLKQHATQIYVCGDRARQKFYMLKDGKKEEDTDCENIIGLSTPGFPHVRDIYEEALFTTHEDITEEQIQENYRTITNMDKDRTQFKSELSKITMNEAETPLWQKAVNQLKSMREAMLPYEIDK